MTKPENPGNSNEDNGNGDPHDSDSRDTLVVFGLSPAGDMLVRWDDVARIVDKPAQPRMDSSIGGATVYLRDGATYEIQKTVRDLLKSSLVRELLADIDDDTDEEEA
jgi:hypothetical protein